MNDRNTTPITALPGVGPARAAQLGDLGIHTVADLLYFAPFRYETVQREVSICDLVADETVCIHAKVISKFPIRTPRFRSMLKVKVADQSGSLDLMWFNNSFMINLLTIGESYYFTGKVSEYKHHLSLSNPTVETQEPLFGSLLPIYHESADINSRYLRKLIRAAMAIANVDDEPAMIPVYTRHQLVSLRTALECIHQLKTEHCDLKTARERLAFDEMFTLIKSVIAHKKIHQSSTPTVQLTATNEDVKQFMTFLPYALTPSQQSALQAISLDLVQPHPMHRLIQGEVGSGKTTVAAFALWIAAKAGHTAILICPTNILASQHCKTLQNLFENAKIQMPDTNIRVGLYTGKEKSTDANILVGTHALFNVKGKKSLDGARDLRPAVVIIDEEHRFGVDQRESFFRSRAGGQLQRKPHFLSMTATPIPRTVALTALADRDISRITPHKDSSNIKTWVTPIAKRQSAYDWIKTTIRATGGQGLIVCPFIEESLVDTLSTVKSAKKEFTDLKKIFSGFKLGLLHGQLKNEEKDELFAKMMAGKLDILVTTPVVEVGVDIPKANIMVIEGAERYGLAALHQLRGRVGRRGQDAYCLLFTSEGLEIGSRLQYFSKTYDGNALAEYDLKSRGSGELLGVRQHGFDSLRFASWSDLELIEACKAELANLV